MDPSVKMYEWIASNKALGWNGGQTRLRFDDDSAINVNVHLLDDCSEFQLTEYTDLASQEIGHDRVGFRHRCRTTRRTEQQLAPYRWRHRCDIMMAMRPPRMVGWQALVASVAWRMLVWLLVLTVLVCAIGGWGLPDDDPLLRVGATAFAIFLGYIAIRFEMMLRSAARASREN